MFICLYEVNLVVPLPPQDCVYILQTRPSLNLLFFSHLHVTAPYFCFQPFFFIAESLANFVVFTWSSRCLSKYPTYLASIFIVWKRHIVICSEVHAVSADLPFHRSDTKLGPAGEFTVDSVSNAHCSAAWRDGLSLFASWLVRWKTWRPRKTQWHPGLILIARQMV